MAEKKRTDIEKKENFSYVQSGEDGPLLTGAEIEQQDGICRAKGIELGSCAIEEEQEQQDGMSATCEAEGQRLDVFLTEKFPTFSRSKVSNLILKGCVTVDGSGCKSGQRLKVGQKIQMHVPVAVVVDVLPQDIPLKIVYEDEDLLIVDKPKGIVVHPSAGHEDGTLVNALMYHCGERLSDINGVIRPGIVHRIDRDTSGLLVVAKNNQAHLHLSTALQNHNVKRTYLAVVDGVIKADDGTINAPIGRHPIDRKKMAVNRKIGRSAITHFRVIRRYRGNTYIECELETGRTHQIRVHMAHIGHAVTGDFVYGKACKLFNTEGQALHAKSLSLTHPRTGETVSFESEMPNWMSKLVELLEKIG